MMRAIDMRRTGRAQVCPDKYRRLAKPIREERMNAPVTVLKASQPESVASALISEELARFRRRVLQPRQSPPR